MPRESVNIIEINRSKASERVRIRLSVILQCVDYFGGILNRIKVSS